MRNLGWWAMPEFRVYIIVRDGHIHMRLDLIAPDEDNAREQAKELMDGHAVELWEGARLIAAFDPPS